MAKRSFWATRPFGYGKYPMLDVGQVISESEMGERNDEKLLRLGLLRPVTDEVVQCGKCGAFFNGDPYLNQHGRRQHSMSYVEAGRREAPEADLATAEALGKLQAVEKADDYAAANIPLHLDKTKASQGSARASR